VAESIQNIASAVFMPYVVAVLLGTGLFLSIRFRFVQFRRFPDAVRAMLARQAPGAGGVLTPFQAFMTALGASVGTGNIAGVATAIITGGPGALFWIWVYGLVATAIKFAEAVLAIEFRRVDGDVVKSGPMYYLRDGLKSPALAWLYALLAGIGALTTTPFTQPNSIAVAVNAVFGIPTWAIGVAVAVLVWAVIIGGIRSIGRAAEALAPLKVGLYLIGGLVVIVTFAERLPDTLSLVVSEALAPRSALGFGLFVAMRYGIARGVYANEAGYGTAAVAYGTAKTSDATQQGLQAVMEVFIISFVTTTISALTILVSGVAQQSIAARQAGAEFITSTAAVAAAFDAAVPTVGGWVVAFCVFLFGYTTLTGWAYYGEQFLEYLFGRRIALPYRWVYCLLIPLGAVLAPELVWAWGDLMNALQIFPNVVGLIGLSAIVARYAAGRAQISVT
jgi:AGCS family alanine or glycine:cation symporter